MDIDKSKENIQPLRGGRNVLQLNAALQAQTDSDAQKHLIMQKEEHERIINNYEGPDPLDPWFNYIQWMEQSFPKHGHEGHIDKLIKTCLTKFESDDRYTQDRRFIRLWIKYIDYLSNPLEMYQLLYNQGVGTTYSEFYRAWACYCEEASDYKKADQVYNLGMQAHAQPKEELEQAHMNFQLWFAQRSLHNDSPTKRKAASALAETRMALTSLRTVKRRNIASVPSQRTGDNVRNLAPGVVRQHPGAASHHPPRSNVMVDIYQDNPGPSSGHYSGQPEEAAVLPAPSLLQSCNAEENQREVGIWTNSSTKSGKLGTVSKMPRAPLNFVPYEDDRIVLSDGHVPYCREDFSDFVVPMCAPDPPDPTKIPMYNKKEVYKDGETGGLEFSLEEIKARRYIAAYKSSRAYKKKQMEITEQYQNNSEPINIYSSSNSSNCTALQTLANCALDNESLDNGCHSNEQYAPPNIMAVQNVTKVQNLESPGEPKVLVNLDSNCQFSELSSVPVSSEFNLENVIAQSNSILNADDHHQSVVLEQNEGYTVEYIDMSKPQQFDNGRKDENMQVGGVARSGEYHNHGNENYNMNATPKKSIVADFNRSLMANIHGDSMTVNTKEAFRELDNLFRDETLVPASIVPQFEPVKFEIREDHSMTMAAAQGLAANRSRESPYNNKANTNAASVRDGDKKNGLQLQPEYAYAAHGNTAEQPNVNFDDTCSTQIFNFNIPPSSTPYANQFKKPIYVDYSKTPNIKKFNIADGEGTPDRPVATSYCGQNGGLGKVDKELDNGSAVPEANAVDGTGLSVIMETTREHRSGSSSSGSYQTMRNTMFGYAAGESCGPSLGVISEKTNDSNVNHELSYHQQAEANMYGKRLSVIAHPKGNQNHGRNSNEHKSQTAQLPPHALPPQPSPFHATDHQYHKSSNYNGYAMQRNVPQGYQNSNQAMTGVTTTGYHQQHAVAYQNPQANMAYQNTAYQNQQQQTQMAYHPHTGFQSPQHGLQSPHNPHAGFQSPPHVQPGFQSPQQGLQSPQQGFQSPQSYTSSQQGFTSPQQGFTSPQHGYTSPQQGFTSPQPNFQSPQHQHVYQNQPQQHSYMHASPASFQSPPHALQAYTGSHQNFQAQQSFQASHSAHTLHTPQQQPYQQAYHNQSNNSGNRSQYHTQQGNFSVLNQTQHQYSGNQPSYSVQNTSYQNQIKPQAAAAYGNYPNNQVQQSPYLNYKNPQSPSLNQTQSPYIPAGHSPSQHVYTSNPHSMNQSHQQVQPTHPQANLQNNQAVQLHAYNHNNLVQKQSRDSPHQNSQLQKPPYQSPTSKLRSVRHEVPHVTTKPTAGTVAPVPNPASNPGFSNEYLTFITARNEPKDNANTPKFNNSPNISHKMHKNLYVSSPEQGQIPPSSDLNSSETTRTNTTSHTPISSNQSSISNQSLFDKQKDLSKRQLDFEHRSEVQSEDSRDSASKDSRMSSLHSMHSRQSIQSMHTDNFHMDVDSENSMDCQNLTFKSNCSNSLLTTQEISRPANIEFPEIIDPFNNELCNSLLQYVKFPNKNHHEGYCELKSVPKLQQSTLITLGNARYSVEKQLGKGTFGSVFRGLEMSTNISFALKYQKPGHPWEYYICQEIKARINDPSIIPGYMDIHKAFLGDNASIFVSELSKYGSLLDVANKIKVATTKCINELIVMLLASEMLSIVHYLHKAEIIHADIKPDNFLLMKIPQTESRQPSLQLIDLGCAIDMSLFPDGTTFRKVISTDGFTCTEMRDGRPWTYQTDLFCLAGTVHVILMGSYMQIVNRAGQWNVEKKWPRYMKAAIWDKVFLTLLNIKDCSSLPDLLSLKDTLDESLRAEESLLYSHLRKFANVLKSR